MSRSHQVLGSLAFLIIAWSLGACGGGGKGPADVLAPVTTATPAGGTYHQAQSVTLSCDDSYGSGCVATYYTLDGSEPTADSTSYSGPIAVEQDTQLQFFSIDREYNQESVKTEDYVIEIEVEDTDAPVTSATPAGGTYDAAQSVVLSCDDGAGSGCAATYYTLDGSEPTQASPVYASAIAIGADTQLRFLSVDQAGNAEVVRTEDYVIEGQEEDTDAPVTSATPAGGTYDAAQSVVLSCDDGAGSGCAATYYTLDGSEPTQASQAYASAIAIDADTQLRFFSIDQAGNAEAVQTEDYVIEGQVEDTDAPVTSATPPGGTYDSVQSVVLTCDDGGGSGCAGTYYTVDGSLPTQASLMYANPINVSANLRLRFFSIDQAGNAETAQTADYQVDINTPPVADAGPDQEVVTGAQVQLDGTGSSDADQDGLTYGWAMPTVPAGSIAALDDPSSAQPSFTADLPGEYRLLLTVNDGQDDSSPDEVIITAIGVPPQATVFPPSGSPLGRGQSLVVTFDQSMDPATLGAGGDMGTVSATWSDGALANDTLTLSPQSNWNQGWLRNLTLDAESADGVPLDGLALVYDVLAPDELTYYYVDGQYGSNANDGLSPQTPMQTLEYVMGAVNPPAAVLVAEGDYLIDGDPGAGARIVLNEDVNIYGGYESAWPDDFASRDIDAHPTRILDQSDAPGVNNAPIVATNGSGVTPATVVSGFHVFAGGGTACAAILIDNASPTLRSNTISGGDGCDYSYGVWLSNGAAAQIQDNTIYGGTATQRSYGVFAEHSQMILERNQISGGGGGGYSYGASVLYSNGDVVRNNLLAGGSGTTFSFGLGLDGAARAVNNTIDGGASPLYSVAVYYIAGPVQVENNILFASGSNNRVGFMEGQGVENPDTLYNNDFFDCPDGLYVDYAGGNGGDCPFNTSFNCLMDPAEIDALGDLGTGAGDNLSMDPGFADRAGGDQHLTPASPVEVREGGLDLSAEFGDDAWWQPRTVPWSIGADEQD